MLLRSLLLASLACPCVAVLAQDKPPSASQPAPSATEQVTPPSSGAPPTTQPQDVSKPPSTSVESQPTTTQSTLPDSKSLKPVKVVKASYPAAAEADGLQGEVVVKLVVSETGDVDQTEIVSGNPVLGRAAMDAARQWKFEPFIRNGKPEKVTTNVPFDFAFKGKVTDVKLRPQAADVDSAATAAGIPQPPNRVRVAQGVVQGMVVHRVAPVYPPQAKLAHIQGVVVLAAVIGKDGKIKNLRVMSGPLALQDAAIGAVQQWRYRPYILLGEPVEVDTTITVTFTLR